MPTRKPSDAKLHDGRGQEALFLNSVARAMDVLETFGAHPKPMSIAEIAALVGCDKSAAQRVIHTLCALGYLDRCSRGVVPGKKLLYRAFDYLRMSPIVERATPLLLELRKSTGERVDLSLPDHDDLVYVVRLQSKRETFSATLVGRRIPIFCSSGGRAILACRSDGEVRAHLERCDKRPLTPRTITDTDTILGRIDAARRDGYALALEESSMGEIVLAAAVLDFDNRPVAAIHVSGSLSEWEEADFRKRIAPLAMEAARALSGKAAEP